MAEQLTLNQWVLGSSPRGRTLQKIPLILRNQRDFCVPLEMQASWVEESVFVLVPTGGPVLAELGHPDVTTDDTDSSDGFCGFGRGTLSRRGCGSCAVVWVCAPCLANWGGGGLSRFSVLLGGWCFACGRGRAVAVWSATWRLGCLGWCAVFSGSALRVSHGRSPQRSKEERSVRVTGAPA